MIGNGYMKIEKTERGYQKKSDDRSLIHEKRAQCCLAQEEEDVIRGNRR